jgi:hypothetical protein
MITLSLTVEQVNLILAALGQRPYVDVADLIHRIKIETSEVLVLLLVQIFIVSLIAAGIFWLLENY